MRFYVWVDSNCFQSAWLVYRPNDYATDCTDMDDARFNEFMSEALSHLVPLYKTKV